MGTDGSTVYNYYSQNYNEAYDSNGSLALQHYVAVDSSGNFSSQHVYPDGTSVTTTFPASQLIGVSSFSYGSNTVQMDQASSSGQIYDENGNAVMATNLQQIGSTGTSYQINWYQPGMGGGAMITPVTLALPQGKASCIGTWLLAGLGEALAAIAAGAGAVGACDLFPPACGLFITAGVATGALGVAAIIDWEHSNGC